MFQPLIHSACIFSVYISLLFPFGVEKVDVFSRLNEKIPGSEFVIPLHSTEDIVLRKTAFTLKYNENTKQADWVAYELTLDEVFGSEAERSHVFRIDRDITSGTATNEDYKYSGYDRGHLAPAADMKFSKIAMEESFLFTNICPQDPTFNRGIWASLEAMVRYWALVNEAVLIVSGPIFYSPEYKTLGASKVGIPDAFYKVVLDYRKPEKKGIAFIIPNGANKENLLFFVCSIDDAEAATGENFFPFLSSYEEQLLENLYNIELWPLIKFSPKKHPYPER